MKKIKLNYLILSMVFGLILIVGESYKKVDSITFAYKSNFRTNTLFLIYTIIIYFIIMFIDKYFDKISLNINKNKKYKYLFDDHIWLIPIIIFVCYLPFIILKYPGSPGWDFFYIFKQCFQGYIDLHFPIIYVYFTKLFMAWGMALNNIDLGVFVLTMIQLAVMLYAFYKSFKYLKKWNINYKYRLFLLIFYSLNPLFLNYSTTIYNDVLFASFILLYVLNLTDIILENKVPIKKLFILSILIMITKGNGVYIIIPTVIYLLFIYRKKFKLIYFILLVPVFFHFGISKYLETIYIKDPASSMSIPIQNIARYSKEYHDDIDFKDVKIINRVINYDAAAKYYSPKSVDKSRNKGYNYSVTKKELMRFVKVWIKLFNKHPDAYIESFINITYQLYYPFENTTYLFTNYPDSLTENDINVDKYFIEKNKKSRKIVKLFNKTVSSIPVIKYIDDPGIYSWALILLIFILRKRKNILPLIPLIMNFLCILVGPTINHQSRYAFPIIFTVFVLYAFYSINFLKFKKAE